MSDYVPDRSTPTVPTGKARVLLVDDEYAVLAAVQRHLRLHYDVTLAEGGPAALELLDTGAEPFAVVCTDMRMPGADGLAVLRAFRDRSPDTTRVLFTGFADLDAAMAAVNEGNVYRFLTKPTDPDALKQSLDEAIKLNRLTLAERELLEHTLRGSVQALLETLSLANPQAFARALRIRRMVGNLLDHTEVEDRWEIEVASMLSQVGAVTLPPSVVDKLHRGAPLNSDDQEMVKQMPSLATHLLAGIPRLDGVRAIITGQERWQTPEVPLGTKLLRLAQEFDSLEARGLKADVAITMLQEQASSYGEVAMAALIALQATDVPRRLVEHITLEKLKEGMELAVDVKTKDGLLLVGRGQTVNQSLLQRIHNFAQSAGLQDDVLAVLINDPASPD